MKTRKPSRWRDAPSNSVKMLEVCLSFYRGRLRNLIRRDPDCRRVKSIREHLEIQIRLDQLHRDLGKIIRQNF